MTFLKRTYTPKGFTLIELMVALTIFAIMSVGVFSVFNSFSSTREITDRESKRLYAYQKAFEILTRDVDQMVSRTIRDEFGDFKPALEGTDSGIEFTRAGWNRPGFINTPRSELQRVRYYVEENILLRQYWNVLDRPDITEPTELEILEGVESIQFKYYWKANDNELREEFSWPLAGAKVAGADTSSNFNTNADTNTGNQAGNQTGNQNTGGNKNCRLGNPAIATLPMILEMTLSTKDFGDLSRSWLLMSDYVPVYVSRC